MARRRAEQAADHRHLAGALRLGEQIGGGSAVVLAAGPEAGAFEQHHQRNPVPQRQLREPIALRVSARADAARQRGEVLGTDHHRRAIDKARAGDDPVGGDLSAHQRAELSEAALVEKVVEACAGVELALAVMLRQPIRTPHRPRTLTPKIEVFERLLPALLVRHALFLSLKGDRRTGMFTLTILNCLL